MMAEGGERSQENVVDEGGEKKQHFCYTDLFWIQERRRVATSRGNTTNIHHQLQHNHKDRHQQFKSNVIRR